MVFNDLKPIQLIVTVDKEHQDTSFWQAGRKFRKLFLSSTDQEEYYIGDNPIPESLSSWARVTILENDALGDRSFSILFNYNGLDPRSSQILDELHKRIINAIELGADARIDLTESLMALGLVVSLQ